MPEPLRVVDASVLVRYLVGDNPEMQALARRVVDSDAPLGLTAVAVLETAYVLHRVYGYPRADVVDMEQESRYLSALRKASSYSLDKAGGTLAIDYDGGAGTLHFARLEDRP